MTINNLPQQFQYVSEVPTGYTKHQIGLGSPNGFNISEQITKVQMLINMKHNNPANIFYTDDLLEPIDTTSSKVTFYLLAD